MYLVAMYSAYHIAIGARRAVLAQYQLDTIHYMSEPAYTKPDKPYSESEAQYKQCIDCRGLLPINYFGLYRPSKDGHNSVCKACRSEFNRLNWTKKYGRVFKDFNPEVVRNVTVNNRLILKDCIFQPNTIDICGFIPSTQATFHIQFGRNRYDMESMAVYDDKGNSYFEVVYSGIAPDKVISQLLANLKEHNIRLERSEGDIVLAKRVVYYL